jgi:hypothetical protein
VILVLILDGDPMKITHHSLVFMLAVAPLLGHDDSQSAVPAQQEEIQQRDDSAQPKTFLDRCYENRYYIMAGIGFIAIAAAATYLGQCHGVKGLVIEPTNPELPQLPQKGTEFVYPKEYGERSKKHVDTLRSIHPVFESMCNGNCKGALGYEDTFECGQAVRLLEEMYRGGENHRLDTGYLIADRASSRLHKSIPDHIEHAEALERIRQTVNNLKPAITEQSVDKLSPVSDQSNADMWDYFYGFLAG